VLVQALSRCLVSVGSVLGGYVAGEGCYTAGPKPRRRVDGSVRYRFRFMVKVATDDRTMLEALQAFLGCGSIADRSPEKPGHRPTSTFSVSSLRSCLDSVVPFSDCFLVPSRKREQYETWRARLHAYLVAHPNRWGAGPSRCRMPGCDRPVRGRGLCRRHYYEQTGW
jgi:hypothetical protein